MHANNTKKTLQKWVKRRDTLKKNAEISDFGH